MACVGGGAGAGATLDRVAGRFRWHNGQPARWRAGGVEVAALVDAEQGPGMDSQPGRMLVALYS